jgi:hypothetical protein
VAEVWGQFRYLEKGESLPLEAVTRGIVKTQLTDEVQGAVKYRE